MERDELKYWLALGRMHGMGPSTVNRLIDTFGTARSVFNIPVAELIERAGLTRQTASLIGRFNDWSAVERELDDCEGRGVSIITANSPAYPKLLRHIHDYPPLLYVKGTLHPGEVTIAVIGSRKASTYGRFMTERLCRELCLQNVTIVSGLARGIDSAAHRAALTAGGRTIAVMGSGMDVIYPPENKELFHQIAGSGAVVTEFPQMTQPKAEHFPRRNRIISGMSYGVVVVEAGEKSGSLITARLALEQGREVFAVPGMIDSPGSRGTHRLLREGAKLVETVHDVLEEIVSQIGETEKLRLHEQNHLTADERTDVLTDGEFEGHERQLLELLGEKSCHIDDIAAVTGRPVQDVLNTLLSLELRGCLEQLPGKIFRVRR
ncbi:MAG: DNA-processing protein DprA [Deltaproteobacteria bacterium]|nr:DNA-processing protein DprA [Deltaproteobacteria bacterium]